MHFRYSSTGFGAFIGCGAFLALFGLVLLTPVGVFLIKAIGWISVFLGLVSVVAGIFYWLSSSHRRHF